MEKKGFEVHCTWKVLDGKTITEAVTWTDGSESPDIEDSIQAENCVLLETPNEDESNTECRILFYCQPPFHIQQLTVLCESRLLEIYGRHAEYLKTVRNKLVDEVDDMIVFRGDAKLERPTSEASIKFTGLKSKSSMWLYGVKVQVVRLGMSPTTPVTPLLYNGTAEERNNNSQFNSIMNSLFPQTQQQQPLMQQHWQQPGAVPPSPIGVHHSAHPMFQSFLSAQPQQLPPPQQQAQQPQVDLAAILSHMNQPNIAQQQQQNLAPLLAAFLGAAAQQAPAAPPPPAAALVTQPEIPIKLVPQEPIKAEPQITEIVPVSSPPAIVPTPVTVTPSVPLVAATAGTSAKLPAPASSSTDKQAEVGDADKLRELAFELRPETVDQITEAVVTNVDCSMENLEARLWGKIVQRLSDMEGRIMKRMEEIVDALREAEEEDDEDIIREEMQEELEDEEEDLKI